MTLIKLPHAIDVKAQLAAIEKKQCELSLVEFIKAAWHVIEPGQPYVDNWHVQYIADHLTAITDGLQFDDGTYYNRLLINIPPGFSKAIEENEPVLTLDGWKRHGDLVPGDYVFSPDGRPVMVLACTEDKVETGYEIEFDDGAKVVASGGHQWVVEREFVDKSTNWRRERRQMTVPTLELQAASTTKGTYARPDRIKPSQPIWMPKRRLLIDPYILGAWLGDGGSDGGGIYAGQQDVDHFSLLGETKMTADQSARGQAFYRIRVEGLSAALRASGLIRNKHVPDEYLFACYDDRLALLQGLMDTDGCGTQQGACSFVNKNKQIADSVAYLVASIGGKPYVSSRYTTLNGKRYGPHYKVEFRAPEGVRIFRLERKQARVTRPKSERTICRYVSSITPVGDKTVKCIQVEGGVYLVGSTLIPTHNSLILNVFWPAWEWGPRNMPHMRYVCVSHAQHLSIRDSIKMRRLVMSEWYQSHWGDRVQLVKDQNQTIKFETTATGFRQSAAAGSVTGARGDRFLIDDPLSVEDAMSATILESRKNWFLEAVPTRLNNPDRSAIIVIMQRLSELDTAGIILDNDMGYDAIVLPMRYEAARNYETKLGHIDPRTEEGELLFPERFPENVVSELEKSLGVYGTAGQLQQIPVPRGGGIIKPTWWNLWEDKNYPAVEYVVLSLDTAYTEKQENDPSAFTIWGVFSQRTDTVATRQVDRYGNSIETSYSAPGQDIGPTPKLMLMYSWSDRLEFHELVTHVAKFAKRYKVDKILIENKAAGHSVAQELRRLFGNENFSVQLLDPKGLDKSSRLYAVQHIFEEGMVYAPDTDWAEACIRQVSSFPKGKHDDIVDTVSQCVNHLRLTGFLTRSAERHRELEDASAFRGNNNDVPLY